MNRPQFDGVLDIQKPQGSTSMDVVRVVKRLTRTKRVGHAGTLDPIATGVLPVCLGQATRLMEYLIGHRKVYQAEFRLGIATDTHDAYGKIIKQESFSQITSSQITDILPKFTGTIYQQPPMYSALKWEGKRLYDLARAGLEVDRPAREVSVYSLKLKEWAPPVATLEVQCGRGVYVRTLVHDIGISLGCGAHLSALERVSVGPFSVEKAITPVFLEEEIASNSWERFLFPPDVVLLEHDSITVEAAAERLLRNGQAIPISEVTLSTKHLQINRAYSSDGRFIGVVRFNRADGVWQPEKIFSLDKSSPYAPTQI